MMRIIALVLVIIAPFPALALSCMPPSIEATFERAQTSTDAYVVVHGRLVVDKRKMPRSHPTTQDAPEMTRIPATIIGRSLSDRGFKVPFEREITLEVACFGPWCGGIASGADVLAFIRRDDRGYALGITPCGGDVFVTPQAAMLKKVGQCFKQGQC